MAETTDYEFLGREWAKAHGKEPCRVASAGVVRWHWYAIGDATEKHCIPNPLRYARIAYDGESAAYAGLGRSVVECRRAVAVGLTEEEREAVESVRNYSDESEDAGPPFTHEMQTVIAIIDRLYPKENSRE